MSAELIRKWVDIAGWHGRCTTCGWHVRRPDRELRDQAADAHALIHAEAKR